MSTTDTFNSTEAAEANVSLTTLVFSRSNLSQHLVHYSKIYPRYIPIELADNKNNVIDQVFYLMPVLIGIPQFLLNLVVLISVVLITRLHHKTHGNDNMMAPRPPRSATEKNSLSLDDMRGRTFSGASAHVAVPRWLFCIRK